MSKQSSFVKKNTRTFEQSFWDTTDKLRGTVESSEYKHVVLSLIFPKFVSDKFEARKQAALIDFINNIATVSDQSSAGPEGNEQDLVGRGYEYFFGKFAATEGKGGGEFYTPKCIVNLLAEMIEPYQGKIYDPCCGSGGMFV
jgi:type I restriction-modification system DNA methylase subunit